MSPPDLHRLLLHPLHRTGIEYMVTGAVAAIAYGEPRMTNDVDVVVRLGTGDGKSLLAAFAGSEYYVPPLEVIEEERQRPRHGHFNIIHHDSALRADIYLVGDDPLHAWALARRHTARIGGDDIWFALANGTGFAAISGPQISLPKGIGASRRHRPIRVKTGGFRSPVRTTAF